MFSKTEKTDKENAEDILYGVNLATDSEQPTDLEKKHLPIITAPKSVRKGECFEVTVEVGKLLQHPNEPGHHIEFVELYADSTYLARMDFAAGTSYPMTKLWVSLSRAHRRLRAYSHCNLHGTWEADAEIEVRD